MTYVFVLLIIVRSVRQSVAEKIITHCVRGCIEDHFMVDEDFVCFKVDMKNAFNLQTNNLQRMCHLFSRAVSMGLLLLWVPSTAVGSTWADQF